MARDKATPDLLTIRTVARRADLDTETIRKWVAAGEFPEPRAIIKNTWFFDARVILHWLDTGLWLESARFKPGVGRGLALATRDRDRQDSGSPPIPQSSTNPATVRSSAEL
jgi:hypothetical protein